MKLLSRLTLVVLALFTVIGLTASITRATPPDKANKADAKATLKAGRHTPEELRVMRDPRIHPKPNDGRDWFCVYVYEPGTFSLEPEMFRTGEYKLDRLVTMQYVLNTWKNLPSDQQAGAREAAIRSVYLLEGMRLNRPDLVKMAQSRGIRQIERATMVPIASAPVSSDPRGATSLLLEGRPVIIDPNEPVPCVPGTTVCTADVCGKPYCSGASTDCASCG